MDAGILRHIGTFEQVSVAADATGDAIETWSEYAIRRMRVVPISAREILEGDKRRTVIVYRIDVRYDVLLNEKMRIVWESKTLNIGSVVDPDGMKVSMVIEAESVA